MTSLDSSIRQPGDHTANRLIGSTKVFPVTLSDSFRAALALQATGDESPLKTVTVRGTVFIPLATGARPTHVLWASEPVGLPLIHFQLPVPAS